MDCVQCHVPMENAVDSYPRKFLCLKCYPKALEVIKKARACPYCGSSHIDWVSRIDDHPEFGDVSMMDCLTCNATGPLVTGGPGVAVLFWSARNMKPENLNNKARRYPINWDRVDRSGSMIIPPGAKPCAHCSSSNVRLRHLHDHELEIWLMICLNCGAGGPRADADCVCTAPTALKWWNDRKVIP